LTKFINFSYPNLGEATFWAEIAQVPVGIPESLLAQESLKPHFDLQFAPILVQDSLKPLQKVSEFVRTLLLDFNLGSFRTFFWKFRFSVSEPIWGIFDNLT
jgi:hypothetical protein